MSNNRFCKWKCFKLSLYYSCRICSYPRSFIEHLALFLLQSWAISKQWRFSNIRELIHHSTKDERLFKDYSRNTATFFHWIIHCSRRHWKSCENLLSDLPITNHSYLSNYSCIAQGMREFAIVFELNIIVRTMYWLEELNSMTIENLFSPELTFLNTKPIKASSKWPIPNF